MKMINIKMAVLVLFLLLNMSSIRAQMNGWPLSTHGSVTVSSDQIWCADRARVISMAFGSGTRTLTITNFEGSFTNGDWVMVIQINRSTGAAGKFTLCEIVTSGTVNAPSLLSSTTNIDVKPYVLAPYSNSWPTLVCASAGDDIVQIVKVKRCWDLTITGGVITCPAFDYNKGTGGILAIMVGNQFNMSGGYLNVTGKGFHVNYTSGGSLGFGGSGAVASGAYIGAGSCIGSNGGSVDNTINLLYSTPYSSGSWGLNNYGEPNAILSATILKNYGVSYQGGFGSIANNSVSFGNITSGAIKFVNGHSNYSNNDLFLGCSGECGLHSAQGGGAGGFGGTGGSSFRMVSSGFAGFIGENGKTGGNAGDYGVGGGILYLKVANSSLSFVNNQKRFIARGTNGGNGGNGGDGGKGGVGGLGAHGGCQSGNFISSGGMGGFGDGGRGGDGADGGDAGCGGTIWILKKSGGTHTGFSNYISNSAGKGGKGGSPGYKFTYTRVPRPTNYSPSLSGSLCNNPAVFTFSAPYKYCPPVVCDCDEVFRHLGSDMATDVSFTNIGGSSFKIESVSSPSQAPIYWDGIDLLSYTGINGSCTTKYECRMKRNDLFIDFMGKVFGQISLQSYTGSGSLNAGVVKVGLSGYATRLYTNSNHLIYEYDPTQDKLTDFDDLQNPYVTAHACDQTSGALVYSSSLINALCAGGSNSNVEIPFIDDAPFLGEPNGNDGADGDDATDGEFYEDDLVSIPIKGENEEGNDIDDFREVIKNKTSLNNLVSILEIDNCIIVNNMSDFTGEYEVFSVNGKKLKEGVMIAGKNMINLVDGVYVVHINLNGVNISKKICIVGI
jgi:hypothetical protein